MKHLFSRSLILFVSTLVSLFIATQSAWGVTLLINSDNVKTADISNDKLAQYEYSNNANIATWKLCSFTKESAYTFTNSKNYTIQSITFEGVAVNNDNKEGTITISNGTTTATGKTTWNNRKSTTLTTLAIDLSKLSIGNTFTIETTYGLALRFTITYTASSSSTTYTITYNTDGGDAIAQETNATALPNSLPTPTKEGYRFDRWYTDEALTIPAEAGATLSDNITLYARWKQLYTVTYDLNGGNGTEPTQASLCEGETFKVASADGITKTGYTFAGWSDGSKTYTADETYTMGTANVILTAQWTALPVYTVTFEYNDEEVTASNSENCCKGDAVSLPTPTRTGYTFKGWYDAATGGNLIGKAGASYTPSGNITLYAQWEKQNGVSIVIFDGAKDTQTTSTKGTSYTEGTDHSDATTGFQWKLNGQKDNLVDVRGYTPATYSNAIRQGGSSAEYNIMFVVPDGYALTLNIAYASSNNGKFFGLNKGTAVAADGKSCSEWNAKIAAEKTIYEVEIADLAAGTYYLQGAGDACYFAYIKATVKKSCNSAGLSFPQAKYTVELSSSFTTPTLTKTTTATATYTSSNTAVATVDENTGAITLVGKGTTTITASTPADGDYCAGEASYQLTVTLPACQTPTITTQPAASATYCAGETITALSVVASVTDGGTLSYQWKKDGEDIKDATNATYTPTEAGTYTCVVTNNLANHTPASITSDAAVITINPAPSITTQPTSVSVTVRNPATLTVVATDATAYQWYTCDNNGDTPTEIIDETNNTLTITPDALGTIYYKVIASNACGTATSDVVSITATDGPCFSMQVTATSGSVSGQTTLTDSHATITGGEVLYDREAKESLAFASEGIKFNSNSDYLKVTLSEGVVLAQGSQIKVSYNIGSDDRGIKILKSDRSTEICSFSNKKGTYTETFTINSSMSENVFYITRVAGTAYLKSIEISGCGRECLETKPTLTANKTALCGTGNVVFTATDFTEGATLNLYQVGNATPLQTVKTTNETSVSFTEVSVSETANYYVVANKTCDVSSDFVPVSILPPTTITSHPTNAVIWLSGKTTLAVEAEGAGTLTYQWYTCESNGSNEQTIAGATAATYTVNPDEEGVTYYKVEVTGTCGTVSSNVVSVTANKLCGELILATLTGAKTADVTGAVAGSAEVNTQDNHKLGSDGHYVGVSLQSGYTFQANDTVVINVTTASSCLRIYSDKGKTLLVESDKVTVGENRLVLPEEADGVEKLYLYRTDSKMNPTVSYMAVRRPCCDIPKIRWSAASAEIDFSDVSPALPTLSNTSGVPVSYSSNDTDVATIDENGVVSIKGAGTTSINAIYTATNATYCSHEVSYTLVVRCAVAPKITLDNSVIAGCNEAVLLHAVRSTDDQPYAGGTYQWYCNASPIAGANAADYSAVKVGTYTVSYSPAGVDCSQMSVNSAKVTSSVAQPVVEKKAPHRNYQIKGRTTTKGNPLRPYTSTTHYPLFDVTPTPTSKYEGNKWQASYTVHRAGTITAGAAAIDWVREDATSGSTISLGADYVALGEWLKANHSTAAVGDTIMLTMRAVNACNQPDDATADSIPIILTDKYSLAYIVTGNTTTRKFYDITASDIADPLYTQLRTKYNVTPVSAYANYNYTNYEPYDLLLLTDYPKATGKNAQPAYVNALADLVDKKPILSLKAHMSALSNWSAKGFTSNPVVPGDGTEGQAQKTLTVLCFSHDMFEGAEWDNREDRTLTILDNVYKDGSTYKGIQGFLAVNSSNFVNIAKVYDAKGNRNLVACCERQDVTEARFIMLSINQGATQYINEKGQDAIDKLLQYLLWTDAANVSDCSLTFDNGEGDCKDCSGGKRTFTEGGITYTSGDNQWNNPANWNAKAIPTQLQNVRIEADCKVSGNTYGAGNVRIKEGKTLTIAPDGGLASVGQFAWYSGNNWNVPQAITSTNYITVQADANKTGMLMHSHTDQLAATVQMYSPAYYEGGVVTDGHERNWTYVGIPVQAGTVPQIFNGAYTYLWSEKDGWTRYNDGKTFHAFNGIALSQPSPQVFTFAGNLALAKKYTFTLTNDGAMGGMNLIGNSWTAPIQITKLETSDFGEGLETTVYIYSTGRDVLDGEGNVTINNVGTATAGCWTAIPIEAAKTSGWTGPKVIPAMQAFEVNFASDATATSATLTLDYNTIVRASGVDYSTLNQKLYAPGRNSTAEILQPDPSAPAPYEPTMLRIRVADTAACYNIYLLQGERFSEGFDNGWDGFFTGTDGRAPGLCALTTAGEMQVSAQPEIDNTTLVFTQGKSDTYTFSFCLTESEDEPLAEPLYLNDMQLRKSCLIDDSRTYTFQSSESDMENRFVISHIAFEEQDTPTGIANLATVDQQLLLNNPARETLTIRIYDPAGKLCSEQQTDVPLLQLSLPTTQGVYMLYITGEHTQILRKAVQ